MTSKPVFLKSRLAGLASSAIIVVLAAGYGVAQAAQSKVTLSGAHEVPAVTTSAKGNGTITVGDDKAVSGSVTTSGVVGTMAHIHEAAAGKNGPVIIPLEKKGDNQWAVPANAKLTDAQYKAYKEGNLYVNVHSAEHKGGEIRDQLKP
ncbi:CHRD domain-containing protein [Eoetvoesiella caeni]|uniref:CHRD domain-containing protein n=1 Tax=Eoetvoesiella caeni TaxID=645616 RepID=A0A366HFA4_9BURK|nr:CHRD domain-containing protein [Eoetvoesiella caeni]MCI2808815.1 CHRD domain-containing protein [Eoetvoesiella caeni]NYT55355.1 CHRD domain-containing protein [Eoetvoesiella caeni]RBP40663.1 CHRD domain-containing protein [Eoetvoesiella caeni]